MHTFCGSLLGVLNYIKYMIWFFAGLLFNSNGWEWTHTTLDKDKHHELTIWKLTAYCKSPSCRHSIDQWRETNQRLICVWSSDCPDSLQQLRYSCNFCWPFFCATFRWLLCNLCFSGMFAWCENALIVARIITGIGMGGEHLAWNVESKS